MSDLTYNTSLDGKGSASGLPLRTASALYERHPFVAYPLVFTPHVDADVHAYSVNRYLPLPNASIKMELPPYISNPAGVAGANTGTYTDYQRFTVKRGTALAAAGLDDTSISYFADNGDVEPVTFSDPEKWGGQPVTTGYTKNGSTISPDAFNALAEEDKKGYSREFDGIEDSNDKIPTGGVDMALRMREVAYGESLVTDVEVDAGSFYFHQNEDCEGFLHHDTGGFDFVQFYNERDQSAGVTLPKSLNGRPIFAQALGNVTDVSLANIDNWKNSAVLIKGNDRHCGFADTDIEQVTNKRFHHYSTGVQLYSPYRSGTLRVPFINIAKVKAMFAEKAPGVDFNFTDTEGGRSGLKVGIDGASLEQKLKYSLLTAADSGYANLLYNYGAPFMTVTQEFGLGDRIVSDLFGNFVLAGSGALSTSAVADTGAGENHFAADQALIDDNADGTMRISRAIGQVIRIDRIPFRSNIALDINPMFTHRLGTRHLDKGYTRARGVETAGLEALSFDFAMLALGGASRQWMSGMLPEWGGRAMDSSKVALELYMAQAIGVVEIAANSLL